MAHDETSRRTSERLDDDELIAILRREEQASANYWDSALGERYDEALNYYDRAPYGDEQDGNSSVVTSEFADVIESLMPGLMRVFTASDNLATFVPTAPGQERWAREASEYVPHVLMRENDGFRIVHTLIKDALMYRLGGATVDLEEVDERRTVTVQGLTPDAIDVMTAEAAEQGADLAAGPDGTLTLTMRRQRVVVETIAPEDIRFTPSARSEDKASFLGFLKRVTASDLRRQGLAQDEIDALQSDRSWSTEEQERAADAILGEEGRDSEGDSERPFWLVVAYVRADVDGDGISEMLRVVYAHAGGTAGRIIERTAWEGPASIALASPILMSHQIVGRSLFDQTQDLQQIGSVLTRGLLDNLYLVNRPRPVVSDQVNLDSLLDWLPGSPIRLKAGARPDASHVAWLQVPNVTGPALQALEHLATVRENRTGVSRYNQGLDADSLNKTLGGLDRIMSASQQRQDLIARVFAETAMRRLYRLIYRAIRRAATGPAEYWNGKAFAHCDPTQWPDEMEVSVDVVGIGNREQSLQHLMLVGTAQEKLIALQGGRADGPFVTAENVATLAQRLTETLGYKTPGLFFQPPERVAMAVAMAAQQQQQQPPQATLPPDLLAAQAQIEIMRQAAAADMQIKREKAQADIAVSEFKARQWAEIERFKAGLKARLDDSDAVRRAHLKGLEIAADAQVEANRPPPPSPSPFAATTPEST